MENLSVHHDYPLRDCWSVGLAQTELSRPLSETPPSHTKHERTLSAFGVSLEQAYIWLMAKFRPGQSGNPGGRPRSAHLSELARAEADACVATLVKIRDNVKAPAAARIAAVRELFDRGFGKAPQGITLANWETSEPLTIRWQE